MEYLVKIYRRHRFWQIVSHTTIKTFSSENSSSVGSQSTNIRIIFNLFSIIKFFYLSWGLEAI